MTGPLRDQPWGLQIIEYMISKCCPHHRINRMTWHQGGILILTYLAYTCYHMTRKPMSIVKNVLSFNCSTLSPPPNFLINSSNRDTWCDWAPFGKNNIILIILIIQNLNKIYYILFILIRHCWCSSIAWHIRFSISVCICCSHVPQVTYWSELIYEIRDYKNYIDNNFAFICTVVL